MIEKAYRVNTSDKQIFADNLYNAINTALLTVETDDKLTESKLKKNVDAIMILKSLGFSKAELLTIATRVINDNLFDYFPQIVNSVREVIKVGV